MSVAVEEREIAELRGEITAAEAAARDLKSAVDADRERLRTEGVNLLTSDRFDEFDGRYKEADQAKDQALVLRERLNKALERSSPGRLTGPGGTPDGAADGDLSPEDREEFWEIAKRYTDSEAYSRLRQSGKLSPDQSAHIHDDPVEVVSRAQLRRRGMLKQRTTVNVGTAGSIVPIDQQVWPPIVIPVRQVQLLDEISMTTTESDVVTWVQQTVRGDFATEVPYGTPAPEADYEFALKQATVKRVPQFIPATKDILADQGQLQDLLGQQLMTGVRLGLESKFWTGGGTSPADQLFQGILATAGIGTVTMGSAGHVGEYEVDVVHRAITTIRLTLFQDPTCWAVHPTDFENTILRKDLQGRYIYPVAEEIKTIWGLRPIITPLVAAGTPVVADFKTAAKMWLRTGLSVTASTEHLDFFTRGMVALLAELRAAFAVVQPRAVCQILSFT
ncbi:MAG: hypothetical protein QOK39_104 [Acidimicrobiaceae bacterium]|jgi:HK97 family phage major capsid protein|nr:hypothetical protein [Acidimicrobiaceae bacterium]